MKTVYLVTGALGHLGSTIVRRLVERGETVRGFALPSDTSPALDDVDAVIVRGDVTQPKSLEALFDGTDGWDVIVIHAAGIVSIASRFQEKVFDVNVRGTANVIQACRRHRVKRLVYVSSVHAIPEPPRGETITETRNFDPARVKGLYAKTKAKATQLVLRSAGRGLDAVIVHPTGIVGPGDYGHAHLTQLVMDYLDGRLAACVRGGYDFVDVRDVADGTIAAADRGRAGECYILSNRFFEIPEFLDLLHKVSGKRRIRTVLPMWFAKATAPLAETYYKLWLQPPLYTSYSLYTLRSNADFSHAKATRELGFQPRDMKQTLADTVAWLREHGRVKF